jgi:hypothetical protein
VEPEPLFLRVSCWLDLNSDWFKSESGNPSKQNVLIEGHPPRSWVVGPHRQHHYKGGREPRFVCNFNPHILDRDRSP